jgi:hypothetical protein
MCSYGMWPWKVPKWPWFWAEVAVKAWRDLATLCTNCGTIVSNFIDLNFYCIAESIYKEIINVIFRVPTYSYVEIFWAVHFSQICFYQLIS